MLALLAYPSHGCSFAYLIPRPLSFSKKVFLMNNPKGLIFNLDLTFEILKKIGFFPMLVEWHSDII